MKKVGIILINFKDYAEKFLAECRDSLREQDYPRDLTTIYIVDNATSLETEKYLKQEYPEAIILTRPDGNYSAGNAAGLKQALADGCEFMVQVNMDVKVDKSWLSELVKAMESDSQIGLVQSKIYLYPEQGSDLKINTVGNLIHFLGFGFTKGYGDPANKYTDASIVDLQCYASGCSIMIRKEVIDKIGFPDAEYYMYHDDIELSWRARLAGYKIVLAPKSIIYHKYEFNRSVRMIYYMERNRYLVMFSFYRLPTIVLILPAMLIMDLGMLAFGILKGWATTKLKTYLYFFKISSWKHIFSIRKKVKAYRRITDKEATQNFAGKILFQEIDNPVLKIVNPVFNLYWQAVKFLIFW